MRKNRIIITAALLIAAGVGAFIGHQKVYLPYKFRKLTDKIITTALARLDEDRLIGQVIHIAIPGTELNEQNRKAISEIKPGGIIFFGFNLQDAEQIKKFTADLQALAKELGLPPFLISTDQEGGYVRRVPEGVLKTPPARNLGDTRDGELCRATGYYVSRDLGRLGINVFFAPIVDINNNPKNPVIGLRSFGTTIDTVLGCALPFEQGARLAHRTGGALPVIKHFPGHGDTQIDSHWALPVIEKNMDQLRAFELVPFRNAIQTGAQAIMTAHILYPQIDKNAPATLSQKWLGDALRGELAFSGLVFTDAMEMKAISQHYKDLNPPVAALKAGADVLLYTSWQEEPPAAKTKLADARKAGEFNLQGADAKTINALERAVRNQLQAKLGLLDVAKYLGADEAVWYLAYRNAHIADYKLAAVTLSEEAVKEKFTAIRWSAPQKRNQPQWLAGKKNG